MYARIMACAVLMSYGIATAQVQTPVVTFTVERFAVRGESPLSAEHSARVLQPFTGEHEGLEGLLSAAAALEQEILRLGFSFRRVILPPQNLRGGTVELEVVAFELNAVDVTGNRHFSRENILRSVPGLVVGEVPSTLRLARSVRLANQHPAKQLNLTFRESTEANAIDATLRVNDARPWYVFGAINNTGTEETGETRVSIGYQHANLFDRDHAVTLSYTTSAEEPANVAQYGVNYNAPLYRIAGNLSAYVTRSDVDSGTVADFFDVSGEGEFAGVRYTHTFVNRGAYGHSLSGALDDKHFRNDVDFFGTPIGTDVRSRPLSVRYAGNYTWADTRAAFRLETLANLSGGADNDEEAYAATRFGAAEDWSAFRYGGSVNHTFAERWLARAVLDAQASSEPLIPGEQFGVGGANSVRGYEEREVAGDSGYRLSAELWFPPFAGVRTLVFADSGRVEIEDAQPGEPSSTSLSSFGAGLRWSYRNWLSVTLDLASVQDDGTQTESGDSKGHFAVTARY